LDYVLPTGGAKTFLMKDSGLSRERWGKKLEVEEGGWGYKRERSRGEKREKEEDKGGRTLGSRNHLNNNHKPVVTSKGRRNSDGKRKIKGNFRVDYTQKWGGENWS